VAKVDKAVVKLFTQRRKQLVMESKLTGGLAGDNGMLLAAVEEGRLIGYTGGSFPKAEVELKKMKTKTITSIFMDEDAAGSQSFGNWRENPAWKVSVSEKTTVYVALNEDGIVDDDMAALLEKRKASRLAAWEKARDKMEAAAVVAEADEKNDELAAKAKDAARIFAELDEAKGAREKREADDEESSFTSLGLHAVRNTRESWIPGVLTGFTTLGFSEYKDDQAWLAVEVDPADGPFFVVPSTWEPGEEGLFTLSLSASCELDVSEVEDSDGLNKVFGTEHSLLLQRIGRRLLSLHTTIC